MFGTVKIVIGAPPNEYEAEYLQRVADGHLIGLGFINRLFDLVPHSPSLNMLDALAIRLHLTLVEGQTPEDGNLTTTLDYIRDLFAKSLGNNDERGGGYIPHPLSHHYSDRSLREIINGSTAPTVMSPHSPTNLIDCDEQTPG